MLRKRYYLIFDRGELKAFMRIFLCSNCWNNYDVGNKSNNNDNKRQSLSYWSLSRINLYIHALTYPTIQDL